MRFLIRFVLFFVRWILWWLIFAIGLTVRTLGFTGVWLSMLYLKVAGGIIYEVKEGESVEEACERLRKDLQRDGEQTGSERKDGSD